MLSRTSAMVCSRFISSSSSSVATAVVSRSSSSNATVALRPFLLLRTSTTTTFLSKPSMIRFMGTVREVATADDALRFSGYSAIDFTIPEDAPVYDAVQKFAAFNIGCLVTVDAAGNMTGVVSERDYVCKVALLGRTSSTTTVKEISTRGANIITATADESVEVCMEKMMNHGVRHLPIVDVHKAVIGMVSIKDLVKTVVKEKEHTIKVLSDFALGKGGHYGSE